jgi:hypothetical protein
MKVVEWTLVSRHSVKYDCLGRVNTTLSKVDETATMVTFPAVKSDGISSMRPRLPCVTLGYALPHTVTQNIVQDANIMTNLVPCWLSALSATFGWLFLPQIYLLYYCARLWNGVGFKLLEHRKDGQNLLVSDLVEYVNTNTPKRPHCPVVINVQYLNGPRLYGFHKPFTTARTSLCVAPWTDMQAIANT